MSRKTGFFSKVGKTRIIPIGLKILLIFICLILLSNFATNYISLQLSQRQLINLNNTIMELVKTYAYSKVKANLSYYRDANAKEIDVFIEENDTIHPIEIKKSASPDRRETGKYSVIDKASLKRGNGGIICMCEEVLPIDNLNCFIPSNII